VTTAAAFVVYGGAVAWVRSQSAERSQTAIAQGSWAGGFLAAVGLANLGVEHFVALGPAGDAIRGVGMWALMFLAFGFTGSAVYECVGSLGLGVVSSVWAAIISTVAMLVDGFSMSLLFMPHMRQILSDTFAHSNMTDPSAFVIYNTLSAAASHTILAPLIAAMFGFGGAITCQLLQCVQRRGGIALGICALVILAVGLEAIRFASSLDRPQRPPYIRAVCSLLA
jgi:hypothetical protein